MRFGLEKVGFGGGGEVRLLDVIGLEGSAGEMRVSMYDGDLDKIA